MIGENEIIKLIQKNDSKIVQIVMDGVGDLPDSSGLTALEEARTPNLDKLAEESQLGLTIPVDRGITPGSGPAHLSIFGYDPLKHEIGRGVLEALGIGLELGPDDLVARANFATRSEDGIIQDRRAGRISTEKNKQLCEIINNNINKIEDTDIRVFPGKEHRFVVKFTGEDLEDSLADADPQETGKKEKFVDYLDENSKKSAEIANKFIKEVQKILKQEHPANTCLLRGLAKSPKIRKMDELFGLNACAIANYPMYKGLSRLVGMTVIEDITTLEQEIDVFKKEYDKYDYFYIHVKKTDSYGEDGNREKKIKTIEKFDKMVPEILAAEPDVLCVTSDHSTPCSMKSHSWHPNPILIKGPFMRKDEGKRFSEPECLKGVLGIFYAIDIMQLLLSQADKLKKFGA
ncbi:MAG: 2,3-bisphosphoglycerate-independent phosphoglycerate mutase [Elusimicrobiota bacterium]